MIERTSNHLTNAVLATAAANVTVAEVRRFFLERQSDEYSDNGLIFDLTQSSMPLDERTATSFLAALVDSQAALFGSVALVVGDHRSYFACLIWLIQPGAQSVRTFNTIRQAEKWLSESRRIPHAFREGETHARI